VAIPAQESLEKSADDSISPSALPKVAQNAKLSSAVPQITIDSRRNDLSQPGDLQTSAEHAPQTTLNIYSKKVQISEDFRLPQNNRAQIQDLMLQMLSKFASPPVQMESIKP